LTKASKINEHGYYQKNQQKILENGNIIEKNLRKARVNVNDLLEECREKNIFDIAEAEFVILETDGKVSVLPKAEKRPLTPQDIGIKTSGGRLCYNVIIDGKVMDENLSLSGNDRNWLNGRLNAQGLKRAQEVLLGSADSTGTLTLQKKGQIAPKDPFM
jgi:uncharacterized membrane protein YcaP (DUF421 family)